MPLRPAFPDVRAAGFLANRGKVIVQQNIAGSLIPFRSRCFYSDPTGFALNRRIRLMRLFGVTLCFVFEIASGHGVSVFRVSLAFIPLFMACLYAIVKSMAEMNRTHGVF